MHKDVKKMYMLINLSQTEECHISLFACRLITRKCLVNSFSFTQYLPRISFLLYGIHRLADWSKIDMANC
jgi:hypothetical protein